MSDTPSLLDSIAPEYAEQKLTGKHHSQRAHDDYSTPEHYIKMVRRVFGRRIGCDPASSDIDNKTIDAEVYYTHERSGIVAEQWPSPIFLNPPSIRRKEFLERTAHEAARGAEIIVCLNLKHLCNEYTQPLLNYVRAAHMPKGRPPFLHPETRERNESPTDGRIFLYIGDNAKKFVSIFSKDVGWTFNVIPAVKQQKRLKVEIR